MPLIDGDVPCALLPPNPALGPKKVSAIRDSQPNAASNTLAKSPPAARLEIEDVAYNPGSAVTLPLIPSAPVELPREACNWENGDWAAAYRASAPDEYARFRLDPEREISASGGTLHQSTLALPAIVYRVLEKNAALKLVVAGHSDVDEQADTLAAARAENLRAILTGDRDQFIATCQAHSAAEDLSVIGQFVGSTFGWSWTEAEQRDLRKAVATFRAGYNHDTGQPGYAEFFKQPLPTDQPDLGPADWGGLFDCYMLVLTALMGGKSLRDLARFRSMVKFVDDDKRSCGYRSTVPRDAAYKWRSQGQRRVEVLFIPEDVAPRVKSRGVELIFTSAACEFVQVDPKWFNAAPEVKVDVEPSMSFRPLDSGHLQLTVTLPKRTPDLDYFDYLLENPPKWPGNNQP